MLLRALSTVMPIVKGLAIGLVGLVVWCSSGWPALAAIAPITDNGALIAVAASSRFAAQAEAEGAEPLIPADRFAEMREKRRQWQSEASGEAEEEAEAKAAARKSPAERFFDDMTDADDTASDSEPS